MPSYLVETYLARSSAGERAARERQARSAAVELTRAGTPVRWRPITAIREAETDGNPATVADPNWLPLIPTPPYPDHSSGHSGISGSIAATLEDFFGTDDVAFTDTNNAGLTRSWTSFSQGIDEIVDARVWSGIHFRAADDQGYRIGQQVANWREKHFFQPVRGHQDDDEEDDD